jgi:hypothetical protein
MKKILAISILILSVVSCKDVIDASIISNYYMTAQINDMDWSADKGFAAARLDYNDIGQAHYLSVLSQTDFPLADSIRYQLYIYIKHPVAKGRFYFNIGRAYELPIGGVAGTVRCWKMDQKNKDSFQYLGTSINGYVEITDLTKTEVGGVFEYTAVTLPDTFHSGNDTIVVKSGKFHVPINLVSGRSWPGPN